MYELSSDDKTLEIDADYAKETLNKIYWSDWDCVIEITYSQNTNLFIEQVLG
jgi:hypothetical protein